LQRVREGSEEAARELVNRYGDVIRRSVRRALDDSLRAKFDSLDFVQLVWSSFFRDRDVLDRFQSPQDLVAFLVGVTHNKVGMEARRRLASAKYNINRERSLDGRSAGKAETLVDPQPTPPELAIAHECWQQMLQDQPQHYRQIVEMRLQGYTYRDIAHSLHLAECTVRRFVKRLDEADP
jgi:RNA polymerase sigma factor (sigma-70 family)